MKDRQVAWSAIIFDGRLNRRYHEGSGVFLEKPVALGCLAQAFTAHAILALVDKGLLALHDAVASVLPAPTLPVRVRSEVTVGHLLAHTAGLQHLDDFEYRSIFVNDGKYSDEGALFDPTEPTAPAGEIFGYSDLNYILLGFILRKHVKSPWRDSISKLVFDPMGLPPLESVTHQQNANFPDYEFHTPAWTLSSGINLANLSRYAIEIDQHRERAYPRPTDLMRTAHEWWPRIGPTDILGFTYIHTSSGAFGYYGNTGEELIGFHIDPNAGSVIALAVVGSEQEYNGVLAKFGFYGSPLSAIEQSRENGWLPKNGYAGLYESGQHYVQIEESEDTGALFLRLGPTWARNWQGIYGPMPPKFHLKRISTSLYIILGSRIRVLFLGLGKNGVYEYVRYGSVSLRRSDRALISIT